MTWEARIDGPGPILQQLALAVSDDDLELVKREDAFFLRAPVLDAWDDAEIVRHEAERIIALLSGSARLCLGSTESLRVADVADAARADARAPSDGERGDPRADSQKLTAPAIHERDDQTAWSERSSLAQSVRTALSNAAIEEALRLRNADDADWPQVVRMYEIVEQAAGGKRRLKTLFGVTDAAIARLHHASGESRQRSPSPVHETPDAELLMTLAEARRFVDHLLMAWLGSTIRRAAKRRPHSL
jgi:hypothetical protein